MITLKDIALETGLTVTTVSRVLNNRGYISKDTRTRVYSAMDKLNYQPNEAARSLAKKSTNVIGVIVPDIGHPRFARIISLLENNAYLHGKKIFLFESMNKDGRVKEYLKMCSASRVSGIILCSGNVMPEKDYSIDIPVISLEGDTENITSSIQSDNGLAGRLAAKHLISCGCSHLLYFNFADGDTKLSDYRAAAFQTECERANVSCKVIKTNIVLDREMEYNNILVNTLRENPEVDGIFTSSDTIAAQLLQVCHQLHIEVPLKIKIVGFGDADISKLTIPQITTIHLPLEELARITVDLIVRANEGVTIPSKTILPVLLIRRGTT
ncbi:MAG: Transcriptional regulator [Firmicutes bacterium]|nr:Transcriptional regulator [Bacillota bacterium]